MNIFRGDYALPSILLLFFFSLLRYIRQWGFENEQDLAEEESFFGLANSSELVEVERLAELFDQCMRNFLTELDAKVHGSSRNMSTSVDLG